MYIFWFGFGESVSHNFDNEFCFFQIQGDMLMQNKSQ